MNKGRLEAFSDGVIAILITIMVLDLKVPQGSDSKALLALLPTLLTYAVSFIFIGIYWNNHHHMFQMVSRINGKVLWANLHLLFWLSLVPFVSGWIGENLAAALPTAAYGVVLLASGAAYSILLKTILTEQGPNSKLAEAVGRDKKGKLSLLLYSIAIPMSFVRPWIADGIYVFVSLMWFIPDRRIESR